MNFSLKTTESSVLKTVVSIMSDLSSFAYLAVTKDGMKMTCEELEYANIEVKFEIKPEELSVFEHYHDTYQAFHPSDITNYLRKVSRSDTLKISDNDDESTSIKSIFNQKPEYTFKTQKIMMLKKIQSISPKIRLYFKSGCPMLMIAETSLGPLKFLISNC